MLFILNSTFIENQFRLRKIVIRRYISKIYTDIPRYTKYQEAAGPAWDLRRDRAGRCSPAAAQYFVYLGIPLYILDICGYIWIYVWSILVVIQTWRCETVGTHWEPNGGREHYIIKLAVHSTWQFDKLYQFITIYNNLQQFTRNIPKNILKIC